MTPRGSCWAGACSCWVAGPRPACPPSSVLPGGQPLWAATRPFGPSGVRRDRSATCSGATTAPPLDPQVLATTDGRISGWGTAGGAGALRRGRRLDGLIWVFGGQAEIRGDGRDPAGRPATGAACRGRPPAPAGAGRGRDQPGRRIYVAGGVTAGQASPTVFQFDPATSRVTAAGKLPVPVGYAAAAVTGGVGYLIGGEDGSRPVPAVTTFRLVTAGQMVPNEATSPWLAPAAEPGRAGARLGSRRAACRRADRRPSQQPAADHRPAGTDQVAVPAARRPRARSDVPAAGRRVLLPGRQVHHRDPGRQPGHQRDLARHQHDRLPLRRARRAGRRAGPPVQPRRRDAHPGRGSHLR